MSIRIQSISKTFKRNAALDSVCAEIEEGELVALIGPSGSGKSTLLRHIAGLEISDRNADCSIKINGECIQSAGRLSKRIRKTRSGIGVIFQQFNLINRMDVLHNVLIGGLGKVPLWRGTLGIFTCSEKQRAMEALDRVDLLDFAYQRASTLSGGQQQRVAIARTMMQQADIILADEPIASLDPKSAKSVMRSLRDLRNIDGKTVIITLHQVEYARKYCKRAIALVEGKVAFDGKAKDLTDEVLEELYSTSMTEEEDEFENESTTHQATREVGLAASY